jgi:hypothetical protein
MEKTGYQLMDITDMCSPKHGILLLGELAFIRKDRIYERLKG